MVRWHGRWPQFCMGIAILSIFALFPVPVEATVGIGVTPTQVSVEIEPGNSASGVITVSNEGDVPLAIRAYPMERRKDNSGLRFLDPGDPRISAARWLGIQPETFSLSPGTAQEVRVPPSAPPGDHVAVALFQYAPPSPGESGSKMVIGGRVGTIVAVRVPGEVVEEARIISFGLARRTVVLRFPPILGWTMKPVVWQLPWLPVANNPPVPLELVLENRGNVQIQPEGEVALYDVFGRQSGTVRVQSGQPVYPNDTSRLEIVWDDAPLAGLFRARLSLRAGGAGRLERQAWVGVFPWRQGLSLVAASVGITLLRRSWRALRSRNGPAAPERWALQRSLPASAVPPSPGSLSDALDPAGAPVSSSFPPRRLRKGPLGRATRRFPPSGWVDLGRRPASARSGPAQTSRAVRGELEEEAARVKLLKEALFEFRSKMIQLVEETDKMFQIVLVSEMCTSASGRLPGSAATSKGGSHDGDDPGGR